ncbi:RNA polymerase sigma factor [Vallicoccus soli]|uniref:RNA polymerase sigma factor n=1 Tax=Vallicoccus soli TaxID=2339232 RepID=UPI0014041507|nr:sigma-70 family RNA polymerase sigma factor [Vallicoccus soli]
MTTTTCPPPTTEHPLLRAARGDAGAWTELHRRYDRLVRGVARRQGLCPSDVDEVAQRTWLRLLEHAAEVRDPLRLPGWVSTTARREGLALRHERWRQQPVADVPEVAARDDAEDALDRLERERRAGALHAAVRLLPAHQRRVVRALLAHPDASYVELAALLGVPVGSVGPTRQRALRRLRLLLDPSLAAAAAA